MVDAISDCLRELRSAPDIMSIDVVLGDFFSSRGIEDYAFHDPSAPLIGNHLTFHIDQSLKLELDREEVWRFDPLRLQGRTRPLIWQAGVPTPEPDADRLIWNAVADVGYRQAMVVPIYGPTGHCDVLSVLMRDRRRTNVPQGQLINELVLLTYDLGHFFRTSAAHPTLTQRERDCLTWTARGKTAWEISRILGFSERTANFHLQNAMRKLGANSKHQAALAALRLGIISSSTELEAAASQGGSRVS